jgi:hypothetical protein
MDIYNPLTDEMSWIPVAFTLENGQWALLCSHLQEGQFFLWLWVLLGIEQSEKLECKFTVGDPDGISPPMVFPAPVYPIKWDRRKVMQDERCVRLSTWSINEILTPKKVSPNLRMSYSDIVVCFKVSVKA